MVGGSPEELRVSSREGRRLDRWCRGLKDSPRGEVPAPDPDGVKKYG